MCALWRFCSRRITTGQRDNLGHRHWGTDANWLLGRSYESVARMKYSVLLLAVLALGCTAAEPQSEDPDTGERLESGEVDIIKKIAAAAVAQVEQEKRAAADGVARRDAHAKAHGCVTASLQVNADIPEVLRGDTFLPGARYDAWVRFSNGSKADDTESDARGMAIKLLNVPGTPLIGNFAGAPRSHDLVLSNHHTFFIKTLADYVTFMETMTQKGNPISFFVSWNPLNWHLREAKLASAFTGQAMSNPLRSRYWSVTPYQLGTAGPVKYSMTPCEGADTSGAKAPSKDAYAAAMKAQLNTGGACFVLSVQRRTRPTEMPTEDATITWEESNAPFVPIARLQIPKQVFDTPAQKKFCESLSYSPWHASEKHKPLGSTNRARGAVYAATQSARARLNGIEQFEPRDLSVPSLP